MFASSKAVLLWDEGTILTGNDFIFTVDNAQIYNSYAYQSPAANGDEIKFDIILKKGTYNVEVLGITDNNKGIQKIYIDDVYVGEVDWYSAATVRNVYKKVLAIEVTESKLHTIKFKIDGKNGSSSAYAALITKVIIQ